VLLVEGHDLDRPERHWWFTVGGGIAAGESPQEAAARELFEETGLQVQPQELVGPVLTRTAIFDFLGHPICQDEQFFVLHLDRAREPGELSDAGWTSVERDFMDGMRWWPLAELAAAAVVVYPAELAGVAAQLVDGWDGIVRELGVADENHVGGAGT
jgi:8-oxo-dGTP pyrophosphatase MutT (NUDIX family)